ncbi:MAG TPA: TonB-dependent receptor [Puia sp.]|nr:TonB-dependent receptor [Puia sp.]
MIKKSALLFLAVLNAAFLFAQRDDKPGLHALTGMVRDSLTGALLEKASITLKGQTKFSILTDDRGRFYIKDIPAGPYALTIVYIGYSTYYRPALLIGRVGADTDLGPIGLNTKTTMLEKAIVTGSRPLLENKVDRIVYNVDRDVTSQGGVATDVLRKIPQVSVDVNGNVELLGNPSVLFLINGKRSTIFGNSIVDALQSIPASQIQSIEVMSSPGARYDATGTGGVINIILKKTRSEGISGAINVTGGTRQENGSVNVTYKKNNVTVSGYFSGTDQLKVSTMTDNSRNSMDTASGSKYFLGQQGRSDFLRYGYRTGLSLDWDLTPKDNIAVTLGFNEFGNSTDGLFTQHNTGTDGNGNGLYDQISTRNAFNKLKNNSADIGVDYSKKFSRERQLLSFSFLYSAGQNNSSYRQDQQYITNDSVFTGSFSNNPGRDHLSSFSLDYAYPLSKGFLLETGLRTEMESFISDANVYSFDPGKYRYSFDSQQSYTSTFRRSVYAGYVSGSFKLFDLLNVITGIRSEYTVNKAYYSNSGHVRIPDYNNLAPSITVSHTFDNQQTLKFSYAYRLERPEYRDLNPFINLADPQNIVTGNPNIKPEIGHDFQLGYNYNIGKDNNLNMVLVYTHNSPDIKSYTTFYPSFQVGDSTYTNVNLTQRSNIASENRWGINIGGSFSPFPRFTIRPNIQLYDRQTINRYSIPARVSGFEYRWNINASYQFPHGLIAEGFGNYRSGTHWQGRQADFLIYTFALRQQFSGGKASLGLVAVNPFSNYLIQHSIQQGVGFLTDNRLRIPYRSFGINFLYKFGKLKIGKPKEGENFLARPPVEN